MGKFLFWPVKIKYKHLQCIKFPKKVFWCCWAIARRKGKNEEHRELPLLAASPIHCFFFSVSLAISEKILRKPPSDQYFSLFNLLIFPFHFFLMNKARRTKWKYSSRVSLKRGKMNNDSLLRNSNYIHRNKHLKSFFTNL